VSEIAAASQEQSAGIEQVNQAVGQMDEMTQQNAALVEEAAAASQSLREQAFRLSRLVDGFKLAQGARPARAAVAEGRVKPLPQARAKTSLPGRTERPKRRAVGG
jgi:hypothetical protein